MKRKIVVYLSATSTDGGKYQYSQSIAQAVEGLGIQNFNLFAVFFDKRWETELSDNFKKVPLKRNNILIKILKRVLFKISPDKGRDLWRIIGKFLDNNHKTFFKINPDLVIYAGKDPFIHEINLPGIIPIFDLMHRFESFPELHLEGTFFERELYYTRLCRYARAIFTDSEVGRQHVIKCYPVSPGKIFVVPYAAPPYIYDEVSEEDIRVKVGLPDNYIFYPAQFWHHKNHLGLIEALRILKSQGLIVNCVLVGSKKNVYNQMAKKIMEYDLNSQVFILGYISNHDIIQLYKHAIALVMPTFLGPTNIPQLEAFALDCPVLTSNIYGIPEQVGDAALLFDPKNPTDIADTIKRIITEPDLRLTLIENGRKRNEKFSQQNFNKTCCEIIRSIVNNESRVTV